MASTAGWRFAALAALWALLTGAAPEGLAPGVLAVAATTGFSLWLLRPPSHWLLPPGVVLLVPLVSWELLLGGLDMARRALSPSLPLDPGLIRYRLRTGQEPVPVALAFFITFVPGTIAADMEEGALELHVIDRMAPHQEILARMERALAWAFGAELAEPASDG